MARLKRNNVDRVYWTEGEGLLQVKEWVDKNKLFDGQIAKNIGITQKTLIEWKKKYETFGTVFDTYRGIAALEIVNSLYKSAKGYYIHEQVLDNKGNKKMIRKWVPAQTAAQIFLIKNWLPSEYKDKWDIDVKGAIPVVIKDDLKE